MPAPGHVALHLHRHEVLLCDVLLHGDILPLLDFRRVATSGNLGGGIHFKDAFKASMSWAQWSKLNATGRPVHLDLRDWQDYADEHAERVAALTPNEFNIWEREDAGQN